MYWADVDFIKIVVGNVDWEDDIGRGFKVDFCLSIFEEVVDYKVLGGKGSFEGVFNLYLYYGIVFYDGIYIEMWLDVELLYGLIKKFIGVGRVV